MVALCNRADHYIFALWFLSSFFLLFFFFSPNLSGWRLDVYFDTWCDLSANLECMSETWCTRLAENTGRKNDAKKLPSGHHRTTLSGYIFATETLLTIGKNLLSSNMSSTCPHNMVNFGLLTAEICWRVWGTPAHFNGFRVLAALLHGV